MVGLSLLSWILQRVENGSYPSVACQRPEFSPLTSPPEEFQAAGLQAEKKNFCPWMEGVCDQHRSRRSNIGHQNTEGKVETAEELVAYWEDRSPGGDLGITDCSPKHLETPKPSYVVKTEAVLGAEIHVGRQMVIG